ncbi:hypothetical protein CBM2591_A10193 [Cupriavidus taiwanensis]|nr:hypothetical protein CBM2591_A10193 [Cupriavidus taiwanensis]
MGVGAPDQLPAARQHRRIDTGLLAADADRPGRHRHPRLAPARRRQFRRQPAHIGKARLEAEEIDHVLAPRMAAHHFLRRQPGMRGDVAQVRAMRAAVAHRDLDQLAGRIARLARGPRQLQVALERVDVGTAVEDHGEVVHARHHVDHAAPVRGTRGHGPDAALDGQRGGRRDAVQQRLLGKSMDGAVHESPGSALATQCRQTSGNVTSLYFIDNLSMNSSYRNAPCEHSRG